MNVVIVNDYAFVNGGASKVAILSARALAAAGVKVHFFSAVGPVSPELATENISVTVLDQAPFFESSSRRAIVSGIWDKRAEAEMDKLLDGLNPKETVVHYHSHQYALSTSVFKPAFERHFATIYTCHEYGIACPYACFFDHPRDEICTRKALSFSCLTAHCNRKGYDKKLWTYTRQAVQNKMLHVPDRVSDVVFVSDFSRRILEPYIGDRVRRHTVRNPVDATPGEKRKLGPDSPFLFVGLLTSGKDPVLAARAAAQAGAPIRFIGDGELRSDVLAANPNAVVTGWLPPEEVKWQMLQARAVVLPAKWYETQGLVVQEAAAHGVPAIVSSVSAATETVKHGVNGLIVEPKSLDKVADAMTELMSDSRCCELGQAAFAAFWADPPTLDKHVQLVREIYSEALARG